LLTSGDGDLCGLVVKGFAGSAVGAGVAWGKLRTVMGATWGTDKDLT